MATITGTDGADTLVGTTADDALNGLAGNDVLDGGGGTNALNGGDQDDSIISRGTRDTIDGGSGNDVVRFAANAVVGSAIAGGSGSDDLIFEGTSIDGGWSPASFSGFEYISGLVVGTSSHDLFNLEGLNLTTRLAQSFTIDAGAGDDMITGGLERDTILGGAGNDILRGDGSDTLDGGDGDDYLANRSATSGTIFLGGSGNDYIQSLGQSDVIDAGSGDDTVSVDYYNSGRSVRGGTGSDKLLFYRASFAGTFDGAPIADFEGVGGIMFGSGGNDVLDLSSKIRTDVSLYVEGGGGDDLLIGGAEEDDFQGLAGNDILRGGGGDDMLSGGQGSNLLDGGDGHDMIEIITTTGTDSADGGAGNDVITIRGQASGLIQGGTGHDELRVIGGSLVGNVRIEGFESIQHPIVGSAGDDVIDASAAANPGLSLSLSLNGRDGDDHLIAGDGAQALDGGSGNDLIEGGSGDDVIRGGTGSNRLYGGDGNDQIHVSGTDFIDGGAGNDYVRVAEIEGVTAHGGEGIDTLSFDDVHFAGHFDTSRIIAFEGYEGGITGSDGDDVFDVSSGQGTNYLSVSGGSGDDRLHGTIGFNDLLGGDGNDILYDRSSADSDSAGTDRYDGGAGIDTLDYSLSAIRAYALAVTQISSSISRGTDQLANIENIIGSAFNDTISAGNLDNVVEGGAGDDTLDGGAGFDISSYAGASAGVIVRLGLAVPQATGGAGTDTLTRFEGLLGSGFADVLAGNSAANTLYGGAGDDSLSGSAGDDLLEGGLGNDILNGDGGTDTASFATAASGVRVSLAILGAQDTAGAGIDSLAGIDWLVGSAFDDALIGDAAANRLVGGQGDDALSGGGGDDLLEGDAGNDTLEGGDGIDVASYASATAGIRIDLSLQGRQNTAGAGMDLLSGVESIVGSAFDDVLVGTTGTRQLSGGAGDDILAGIANVMDGGDGLDRLSFADARAGVSVNFLMGVIPGSGGGTGTLISIEGALGSAYADTLIGDAGANRFDGGAGNDVIDGGAGDDLIEGGAGTGADRLTGGAGIDTVSYAAAAARVMVNLGLTTGQNTLGAGGDTLSSFENLTGSAFNDTLTGAADVNRIEGGLGNDMINGLAGNDILVGGDGNDTLMGGAGDDSVDGGAGVDIASYADATAAVTVSLLLTSAQNTGGGDTDTLASIEGLIGSAHNDTLTGTAGDNSLSGGAGNDVIRGDLGNDIIDGDFGVDTLDYSLIGAGVTVNLNSQSVQNTGGAGSDRIRSIENVIGTAFADTLTGNEYGNVLTGGGGNDLLVGNAGNDVLNGGAGIDTASYANAATGVRVNLALAGAQSTLGAGTDTVIGIENVIGSAFDDVLTGDAADNVLTGNAGNDTLLGGLGNDVLSGGAGLDTVSYATAAAGMTVNLLLTTAQNTGGAGIDTLSSIEHLIGSNQADTLTGNAQANTIIAGAGDDVVDGGSGNDMIEGGNGNDVLKGASGDDILIGGSGRDTLTGGAGNDRFVYQSTIQSPASANADRITDFVLGDVLDLSPVDANSTAAGDQAFVQVAAFTGVAGQLTLAFDAASNTTTLRSDADGNGVADFSILFTGNVAAAVTANWVL